MVDMKRRFFLFAAPAIVASASLMKLSVLKPIEPLIVGMDFGGADNAFIMVGKQRMVWNGKMWTPAGIEIKHWSEFRIEQANRDIDVAISMYTPDPVAGTELERRVVKEKVHDYSVEAMRQRKGDDWARERLARIV